MTVWLMLKDEVPRIGCGLRRVEVLSLGPKWVRVTVPAKASGRAVRIRRAVWDRITKVDIEQQLKEAVRV